MYPIDIASDHTATAQSAEVDTRPSSGVAKNVKKIAPARVTRPASIRRTCAMMEETRLELRGAAAVASVVMARGYGLSGARGKVLSDLDWVRIEPLRQAAPARGRTL